MTMLTVMLMKKALTISSACARMVRVLIFMAGNPSWNKSAAGREDPAAFFRLIYPSVLAALATASP